MRYRRVGNRIVTFSLAALELFLGASAIGGALFVVPSQPKDLLSGSPFTDYTIPALALGVLVGGGALLAAGLLLVQRRLAVLAAIAVGLAIIVFELVETSVIGLDVWLHLVGLGPAVVMDRYGDLEGIPSPLGVPLPRWLRPFFMLVGLAIIALALRFGQRSITSAGATEQPITHRSPADACVRDDANHCHLSRDLIGCRTALRATRAVRTEPGHTPGLSDAGRRQHCSWSTASIGIHVEGPTRIGPWAPVVDGHAFLHRVRVLLHGPWRSARAAVPAVRGDCFHEPVHAAVPAVERRRGCGRGTLLRPHADLARRRLRRLHGPCARLRVGRSYPERRLSGTVPTRVQLVVWPIDLIVAFPALFWGGVCLWRRHPLGYVAGGIVLLKAAAEGLTLVLQSVATVLMGGPGDPLTPIYGGVGLGGLVLLVGFLRSADAASDGAGSGAEFASPSEATAPGFSQ